MKIDKELIVNTLYIVEENKIEEAKSKAMSNERMAMTELFKQIQFNVEDVLDSEK